MTQVMPAIASAASSSQSIARRSNDTTLHSTSNMAAAIARSTSGQSSVCRATAARGARRERERGCVLQDLRGDVRETPEGELLEVDTGLLLQPGQYRVAQL